MSPSPNASQLKTPLQIWWMLWAGVLAGLGVIYVVFARGKPLPLPPPAAAEFLINFAGFVPLFVSIVLRWLVLPRYTEPRRALIVFILGLALAEGCGVLGVFVGGPYRDALFFLGVLGLAQYAPFFARRFFEPTGTGFMPNN